MFSIARCNVALVVITFLCTNVCWGEELRVGVFNVDVSPPVGSPLAYDPCVEVTDPLTCRGVVIQGAGQPIVLASIDWLGVANESYSELRQSIAKSVGTQVNRVSVHSIHQHDAPRCDFSAAAILNHYGSTHSHYDVAWARGVFAKIADAASKAVADSKVVNAIAVGQATVKEVASNRRMLDESGKVFVTRYTACRNPEIRALPVGTIDPLLRSITLLNGNQPVAVLTYYATHPQSYYRTGQANPDFPGYARNKRELETGIPHIHFNGAGGNIGAGKWNDGAKENRAVLAAKVAQGMRDAYDTANRQSITVSDVSWKTLAVALPLGEHLIEKDLVATLNSPTSKETEKLTAAKHLAWLRRTRAGEQIDIGCLSLGTARVLHLPGELFVEYQLAASRMRAESFVAMAAYGEYGPGYIGTEIAYSQGGYETSGRASRVGPSSETVLMDAMRSLLQE
ncbi:MAG: hypothetical protein AAFX06_28000 [Planctomycetota bacterium]